MGKIVLLALGIWLILTILKQYRQQIDSSNASTSEKPNISDMLACQHCGLHIPKDECVIKNGKAYCSEAHSLADQS
jgi:uncharacterized protein